MRSLPVLLCFAAATLTAAPLEPKFRSVTIDDKIQIGYGLAVADVDGDGRPDVLLADKRQIVWYRNPGAPPPGAASFAPPIWVKFVIAENLTEKDNVCIAAQDLDGDGKCEIAVGAEWNPADTEKSGAVFYLIPPTDRTQRWGPVKFPAVEPTTHRMKWLKLGEKEWGLVVVPLHGRANKNGEGAPVKVLLYHPPADPHGEWKSEVVEESMHMMHNFELFQTRNEPGVVLGGREGMKRLRRKGDGTWENLAVHAWNNDHVGREGGIGEIREAHRIDFKSGFLAAIEPMHGNRLVVYPEDRAIDAPPYDRGNLLTDKLTEGHALACGDLLGVGSDQIVVGWRGKVGQADSTTGVAVWTPVDAKAGQWRETVIDPDGMACEDLLLADLNGDGKLDIVAAGRATKNVKIYFNEAVGR